MNEGKVSLELETLRDIILEPKGNPLNFNVNFPNAGKSLGQMARENKLNHFKTDAEIERETRERER